MTQESDSDAQLVQYDCFQNNNQTAQFAQHLFGHLHNNVHFLCDYKLNNINSKVIKFIFT